MRISLPPVAKLSDLSADLALVVEEARRSNSPIGYFAALYTQTTAAIGDAITAGRFDRPDVVEELAVTFGGRYVTALSGWSASTDCSRAWTVAFDASTDRHLLVVEHILLGMNAHILLDLGVAAATVCPGDAITSLKGDFDRVNAVLGELVDPMRLAVCRVERWLAAFHRLARIEDLTANVGVQLARRSAWEVALYVAAATSVERDRRIAEVDADVAALSHVLVLPRSGLVGFLHRLARRLDDDRVEDGITALLG